MNTILPYTKRQALVQVFTHFPLDESCAYPVEFMHALRNHISHSVGIVYLVRRNIVKVLMILSIYLLFS